MTNTTMQYQPMKRTPLLRPLFALAAVAATAATLGLGVVAPTTLAAPRVPPAIATTQLAQSPTEVAILPGRIQVVGTKIKAARTASPYVPATWHTRS
jgi:hypothetical protein